MPLCFTVVIKGNEGRQYTYQLFYQPCPTWTDENMKKIIVNMCPGSPDADDDNSLFYKKGYFKKLLDKTGIRNDIHPDKQCVLIADKKWSRDGYYDSPDVVKRITEDIESEGFEVTLMEF